MHAKKHNFLHHKSRIVKSEKQFRNHGDASTIFSRTSWNSTFLLLIIIITYLILIVHFTRIRKDRKTKNPGNNIEIVGTRQRVSAETSKIAFCPSDFFYFQNRVWKKCTSSKLRTPKKPHMFLSKNPKNEKNEKHHRKLAAASAIFSLKFEKACFFDFL